MKTVNLRLLLVAIAGIAVLATPSFLVADPPVGYQFTSYDTGLAEARSSARKVFVYFGREGCGFCDVTNKTAFSVPAVQNQYQANYELVYVDSDSGKRLTLPSGERITGRDLGARFKAFVTPVFVFLEPDGKPILKRVGVQSAEQLLAYDVFVQSKAYQKQSYEQFSDAKN